MKRKIASFLVVVVAVVACSGERIAKHRGGGDEGAQAGEGSLPDAGGSASTGGSAGTGGSTAAGGSAGTISSAGTTGFAGAGSSEPWLSIDASDCEERAEGDCTGMKGYYSSNAAFDGTPALSACSMFASVDGCGTLVFDFDANGCAIGVGPPPEDWDTDEHLRDLRECMTDVFAAGRFTCLESVSLAFRESCLI